MISPQPQMPIKIDREDYPPPKITKTNKTYKYKKTKKYKANELEWGLGVEHEFIINLKMNSIQKYIKFLSKLYNYKRKDNFTEELKEIVKSYGFKKINFVLPYVNSFNLPFVNVEATPNRIPMYEIKNLDYYNTTIPKIMKELNTQKDMLLDKIKKQIKLFTDIDIELSESQVGASYLIYNICPESNYRDFQSMQDILCKDYDNIKFDNDITGSYHFWITLPHKIDESPKEIKLIHQKAMLLLQSVEPLFVALYSSCDPRIKDKKNIYLKGSYRAGINPWSFYGSANPTSYNNLEYRNNPQNLIPKTKINDNKFYLNVEKKINSKLDVTKRPYYTEFISNKYKYIGQDFRRRSGIKGFEFRIWDHFPQEYLEDVLKCVYLIATHSSKVNADDLELPIVNKSWNDAMEASLLEGYLGKCKSDYVVFLNKQFKLNLKHNSSFEIVYKSLITELFKKVKREKNNHYWLLSGENNKENKKPKIININKMSQQIFLF